MASICDSNIAWEKLNNKTVLITGANGMLASYLALAILYKNETDRDFSAKTIVLIRDKEKLAPFFYHYVDKPYFTIVEGDVCNQLQYPGKIDFIIHGASPASPHLFGKMPVQTMMPNVLGTYHLLELARKNQVEGFLFLSSGEVYGQPCDQENITEQTLGALDPLDIRSCYAEGKRAGETMCRLWEYQYGVPAKIARISHTYGPTMNLDNDRRSFAEFVSNMINCEDIILKSDGRVIRPFCYLSDAAAAFFKILLEGKNGEAYNMAGDDYMSIGDLARLLVGLFPERKLNVVMQNRADQDYLETRQLGKVSKIDTGKLKSLGWYPKISLAEGFRRTILSIEQNIK